MTLIAFLPELGLAASDLLLSVDRPGGAPILLPTLGSTGQLQTPLSLSPTRLVRKIHRVKHDGAEVVMLVAGTVSHLRRLFEAFEAIRRTKLALPAEFCARINPSDPLSILDIAAKLTESSGFGEFEFIALHKNRLLDCRYNLNRDLRQTPYFGETIFGGSGAVDLHRWLSNRGASYLIHPAVLGESELEKHYRILNLLPSILLEEDTRASLATINNGVGGYYESFHVDEKGLHPQDAALTLFASIEGRGKDTQIVVRRMFFHLYADDWLFIISLYGAVCPLDVGRTVRLKLSDFELFKAKPILHDIEPPNWNIARLAVRLPSAEHYRLTLYREINRALPLTKRFSHARGARQPLVSISVKKESIFFRLEQKELDHYLTLFPAKPADGELVTIDG